MLEDHRHCIFCGQVCYPITTGTELECKSPNNPLPVDTVGHKPHVFEAIQFGPSMIQAKEHQ